MPAAPAGWCWLPTAGARDLHRNHGGDPDGVHGYMMENSLTACDIMPAAVHLTSSLLSSVAPRERYTGTRNVLYPFGGTGETDNKGKPIVDIGSLELLDLNSTRHQAVLPLNEQMALGATQERRAIEVEMSPLSQSLVIMNPPFTTPHQSRRRPRQARQPRLRRLQHHAGGTKGDVG